MGKKQCLLGLAMIFGCADVGGASDDEERVCMPGERIGLVALDGLELTGSPTIRGSLVANGRISISNEVEIEGDVIGAGEIDLADEARAGAVIEGARRVRVDDPGAMSSAARASNDNHAVCLHEAEGCRPGGVGTALVLNAHQEATLPSGTYYFEEIRINGQARINVEGHAVIHLDGPALFNGGAATAGGDALTVIASGTDDIRLNGGVQAEMFILAPFATVRFAGMQGFRGATLAQDIHVSGAAELDLVDATTAFEIHCE
jgi:hypothetical protein